MIGPMSTTATEAPIAPSELLRRLRAAADTYEEHVEGARIAKERRDELIVQAADEEGHSGGTLARAARLSRTSIIRVLGEH